MARKRRNGGRTTPRGTRPPHLHAVEDLPPEGSDDLPAGLFDGDDTASPLDTDSPLDAIIDASADDLLNGDDPIAAETWASTMLNAFSSARAQADEEGLVAPPFEEVFLLQCEQRADRPAAIMAAALASVVPPPEDRLAASVAAGLRRATGPLPGWVRRVGRVTATSAWGASDRFGDQETLLVGFRQEGDAHDHGLVVLVDHNLSGQAKDAWLGDNFDEVVTAWRDADDPEIVVEEIPLDEALGRVRDAMAIADEYAEDADLRTEGFADHRALIWARLRRAGYDDHPVDQEVTEAERERIVAEFLASGEGQEVAPQQLDTDVERLAHAIVSLRSDYDGQPQRWSPTAAALFLEGEAPHKLLLDPQRAAVLLIVLRAFVRFSSARRGLAPDLVDLTLAAIAESEPVFFERMADPETAGPGKAVLAALQAQGLDLDDPDLDLTAINAAIGRSGLFETELPTFPQRERDADAAPDDVVASAERAVVLARFEALRGFYGAGRKLTQAGHPTRADAKELGRLLGTEDELDPDTHSAARLYELSFTVRWAVSAGALRKEHGRLIATKSWEKLDRKPLQRWINAADALEQLGPLSTYRRDFPYKGTKQVLDDFAPEILGLLIGGPMPFEDMLDWLCDVTGPWEDEEALADIRLHLDVRLDQLVRIFGWAGITERVGATIETSPYGTEYTVGGVLHLTPAGRWWLADTEP